MRSLAYELAALDLMPWLDLLAMPWSREIGNREREKPKLQRLLEYGYRHSIAIVAVDSENYGTPTGRNPNWTQREWLGDLAPDKKLKKIQYLQEDTAPSTLIKDAKVDLSILNKTPAEAARRIKDWFDESNLGSS
jgi:hypothetical protein